MLSRQRNIKITISKCCISPRVKLSISPAFFNRTVPLVSVWAISNGHVKMQTLAPVSFLGFGGVTAIATSATRFESVSS